MNVLTFSRLMVAALLVIAQALSANSTVIGQQQDEQNRQNRNDPQEDQTKLPGDQAPSKEHADDHSPALGVLVSACPGEAVCVRDVIWGSPADEEGIEPGDYILSVDGQKVTTPAAFRKMLEQKEAKQKVNLTVWRQSQQINKTVSLAAESEKLPDGHNAWLGVMLTPTDSEGIEILQVVPGSPADEAGLKSGERILQMNDKEVNNVESFVECVDDIGPGKQLKLAVGGNGSEREVQVTLGELRNAPMRVLREIYSEALEPFDSPPQTVSTESLELIDATLDQMRQQIRTLEKEVRELRSGNKAKDADQRDEDQDEDQEQDQEQDEEQDEKNAKDGKSNDDENDDLAADQSRNLRAFSTELSLLPMTLASAPVSTVFAQQDGRRSDWNRNRGRNWNNNSNWGNRYSLPNYSLRYGSRYGNYYNSYPNYGNSYYRYGGQPYYYNRGYGNNRYGSGLGIYGLPRLGTRSGTGLFWY